VHYDPIRQLRSNDINSQETQIESTERNKTSHIIRRKKHCIARRRSGAATLQVLFFQGLHWLEPTQTPQRNEQANQKQGRGGEGNGGVLHKEGLDLSRLLLDAGRSTLFVNSSTF